MEQQSPVVWARAQLRGLVRAQPRAEVGGCSGARRGVWVEEVESQVEAHGAPEVALNPSSSWTGRHQHEGLVGRRGDEARSPSLVPCVARERRNSWPRVARKEAPETGAPVGRRVQAPGRHHQQRQALQAQSQRDRQGRW